MLELSVWRRQGDFTVQLDLTAGQGVTALFGPSGSGKTSVINMVSGLYRPDRGRIVVDGRVLFDSQAGIDLPPEKRRLGYVFQDGRLFPHLSVRANLTFGMDRVPADQRSVSVDDVVDVLGIGHLLDRRPARLSGGEKQRVAIGRALLASPRILLMDEPLAALDTQRKAEVLPFVASLSKRFAIPILYVSHAMDEVLHLADTLVLMDGGQAAAVGVVEDLLARPDLRVLTGRLDAGAAVKAIVAGHDATYGVSTLAFAGGTLFVAGCDLPVGTPVRVRVHARDVAIAIEPPSRVSIRNVLPATVRSVSETEGHLADIMLDCGGTVLWSRITAMGQSQLKLAPGMKVYALIKALTIAGGDVVGRPQSSSL